MTPQRTLGGMNRDLETARGVVLGILVGLTIWFAIVVGLAWAFSR